MNRFVYGVAVSALILGTGGIAVACEQHAKTAALANPAAAAETADVGARGFILAQSQDDAAKEKADDEGKEKKPEALPSRERSFVLAQMQDGNKEKSTTGEGTKEDSKPEGDGQK